jgi:hypothetical protein
MQTKQPTHLVNLGATVLFYRPFSGDQVWEGKLLDVESCPDGQVRYKIEHQPGAFCFVYSWRAIAFVR